MIKKPIFGKNIIKALSIGLSLAIANQPIVAMAGENETPANSDSEHTFVENKEDVTDAAEEKAETISTEVNAAEEVAQEAAALAGDAPSEEVQEAGEALSDALADEENVPSTSINDVINALDSVENFETIAENKAESAEEQADIANSAVTKADGIVEDVEEIVADIQEKIENAEEVIEKSDKTIESAGDVLTAQKGYDDAKDAVDEVNTAIDNAEEKIEQAKTDLSEAKETYDDAVEEFNDLSGQFDIAEGSFDSNKELAGTEAENAGTSLEDLADKAGDLSAAALQAKADVENSDIAHIKALEDSITERLNNGESIPFTGKGSFAEYFDAVVKNYYVPEMLGGEFVSADWHRFSGNYIYENNNTKSTQGDVLNYCIVTYKDANGEEQKKILNYKISNGNKTNDAKWPGIVIFEKTEHTVLDGSDVTEAELETLDEGILEKKNNSYIKEEDKIYKLSEGTEEVLVVEDDNTTIADKEDTVEYTFEDGKFIKTVKNDVTTTTFTGATLDGIACTLESETAAEDAYKAALQEKIDNLAEGESILIGETEFVKGSTADLTGYEKAELTEYSATGTFSEKFKDQVKRYTDKYVFTNGTYLLGIGEQHDYDEITHYDENNKITIEYAKVTKVNNSNYSWLYDAIVSWGSDKEILEKKLTEKFAKEGKIFVGIDPTNWSIGTADVFIIDAQELTLETNAATEDAATEAFEEAAKEKLSDNAELYNVNVLTKAVTTYGYNALNYYLKTMVLKKDEVISTITYDTTEVELKTEYRNDNWYTGNIVLLTQDKAEGMDYKTDGKQSYDKNNMISNEKETQDTKNFRDTLQAAEDLAAQYQAIAEKAQEAQQKFETAKGHVEELQNLINNINSKASIDKDIADFNASLDKALADFEQVKKDRDTLVNKLNDLKTKLDNKIADLTKVVENSDDTPAEDTTIVDNETPRSRQPIVQNQEDNTETEETENSENNENENEAENTNGEGQEVNNEETTTVSESTEFEDITDGDVALADGIKEDVQMNVAFYWLLLLLLILFTISMYAIHRQQQKKNKKDKK